MNGRTERGKKGDETRDGGREEGSKASKKERKEAKREGRKTIFMNLKDNPLLNSYKIIPTLPTYKSTNSDLLSLEVISLFYLLGVPCGVQNLSSLTRVQIHAACSGIEAYWPLNHQRSPRNYLFHMGKYHFCWESIVKISSILTNLFCK